MKYFKCLAVLAVCLLCACQKELSEEGALSPGNTIFNFEAKINGTRWIADKSYTAAFTQVSSTAARMLTITGLSVGRKSVVISLVDSGIHKYTLQPTAAATNFAEYRDSTLPNTAMYSTKMAANGTAAGAVNILSIDTTNQTISGTFSFVVSRSADNTSHTLTEGFFNNIPYTPAHYYPPAPADTLNVQLNANAFSADSITAKLVAPATAASVPFYIILGQSNTGWCTANAMTPQQAALYKGIIPNTSIFNPGVGGYSAKWENLNVGANTRCENFADPAQFGPEASFFVNMQNKESKLRLVYKQGQGGTTLAGDWRPPAAGAALSTAGPRWQQFHDWFTAAVSQAVTQGYKLDLRGFIWMQGEDDSYKIADANAYLANLGTFFTAFDQLWKGLSTTNNFPSSNYKKVIGRIYAPNAYPFKDIVRAAQQAFCADPANNAVMINCDNYPLQDWVHYNATGQIQFGQDIFNAAQYEPAPVPVVNNIEITAKNTANDRVVVISVPSNITAGNYTFSIPPSAYTATYSEGIVNYNAVSGTLQIRENNITAKRIRATFNFVGQSPLGLNPPVNATSGYFSVRY